MMKLLGTLVIMGMLSGCLIRTRPGYRNEPRRSSKACPPSQHWNGYQCIHNGNGRGNGRGRGR